MNNIYTLDLTETQFQKLMESIVIIIDTREQEIEHITSFFDKRNIKYEFQKLDFGDYSFKIPKNLQLGTDEVKFDKKIAVERKNSLEEISGNLSQNRERFMNEMQRASNAQLILLIENGSFEKIYFHKYETELNPKSFYASLLSIIFRYGVMLHFADSKLTGSMIYNFFHYYCRELLFKK